MTDCHEKHYTGQAGDAYLEQRRGALSDRVQGLRASIFADLDTRNATVLDFGCGSGGVLSRIPALRKVGIEIGQSAAQAARQSGIEIFNSLSTIETNSVDFAISFHAIEHVDNPLEILKELNRVVRPEGRLRLVVPAELPYHAAQRRWRSNADQHLFTWTPLHFGNLAVRAGMNDVNVRLRPMPSHARFLRILKPAPPLHRAASFVFSWYRNVFNTVLDARPGRIRK